MQRLHANKISNCSEKLLEGEARKKTVLFTACDELTKSVTNHLKEKNESNEKYEKYTKTCKTQTDRLHAWYN